MAVLAATTADACLLRLENIEEMRVTKTQPSNQVTSPPLRDGRFNPEEQIGGVFFPKDSHWPGYLATWLRFGQQVARQYLQLPTFWHPSSKQPPIWAELVELEPRPGQSQDQDALGNEIPFTDLDSEEIKYENDR